MATLTIGGGRSRDTYPVTRHVVEVRSSLSASWQVARYAWCQSISLRMFPGISRATIVYDYGSAVREGRSSALTYIPELLLNKWVRIRTRYGSGGWRVRFAGYILREADGIGGDADEETGRQVWEAVDLTGMLDRVNVAYAHYNNNGLVQVTSMDHFNYTGNNGIVIGNRSAIKYGSPPSYVFEERDQALSVVDDYQVKYQQDLWSGADVIEYLLAREIPSGWPSISIAGATSPLEQLEVPVEHSPGLSIAYILGQLINPSRGLSAIVDWDGGGSAQLRIVSVSDVSFQSGDYTFPANKNQVNLELSQARTALNVSVIEDETSRVREVIVRGAPLSVCFSWGVNEGNGVKGWQNESEDAYNNAISEVEGYADSAEWHRVADQKRAWAVSQGIWRDVYSKLTIDPSWDWVIDKEDVVDKYLDWLISGTIPVEVTRDFPTVNILPAVEDDGRFNISRSQPSPRRIRRFHRSTLLWQGYDYTTDPPTYNGKITGRQPLLPLMVFAYGAPETVNGKTVRNWYNVESGVGAGQPNANVRVADDELAVYVEATGLRHIYGDNSFDGSGNSGTEVDPVVDYRDLIVTSAIETNEHVQIRRLVSNRPGAGTKVIYIPEAAVWWVAPRTVTSINSTQVGLLDRVTNSTGIVTRDDRHWLNAVMAMALAYYGRARRSVSATVRGIGGVPSLGSMIRRTNRGYSNSPVTDIVYRFDSRDMQTSFRTSPSDIDLANLSRSMRGGSALGAGRLSPSNNSLRGTLEQIPVRYASTAGASSGGDSTTVTQTAVTGFVGYLSGS